MGRGGGWMEARSGARKKTEDRRRKRYWLRDAGRRWNPNRRTRWCGLVEGKGEYKPEIVRREDGTCGWRGVGVCGSVWMCPVCSARIRTERGEDAAAMMVEHMRRGGGVLFLTCTVRHYRHDLSDLVTELGGAWKVLLSGRPGRRDRRAYGVQHFIRTWDVTHGAAGWHPHFHAVLLTRKPLSEGAIRALELSLWGRWSGYFAERVDLEPIQSRGVRLEVARDSEDVGRYVARVLDPDGRKVAMELTHQEAKTGPGRNIFEIMADYESGGRPADLRLIKEWCDVMKGKRWWQTSRYARRDLLGEDEASDSELAGMEDEGDPLWTPTQGEFHTLRSWPGATSEACWVAEESGPDGCYELVARLRRRMKGRAPPDRPPAWDP